MNPLERLQQLEQRQAEERSRRPEGCQAGDTGYCGSLDSAVACETCVQIRLHRNNKAAQKREEIRDFYDRLRNLDVVHQAPRNMGTCSGCPAYINYGDLFVWRDDELYHTACDPRPELQEAYWARAREQLERERAEEKGIPKGFRR